MVKKSITSFLLDCAHARFVLSGLKSEQCERGSRGNDQVALHKASIRTQQYLMGEAVGRLSVSLLANAARILDMTAGSFSYQRV
jgi:hypothetical protein